MPEFSCRLSEMTTRLAHFSEHTVGSGHAPLALRADWQAQLRRCHDELGFRYVRFHGLLSENYRSGLIWRLLRQCPYLRMGLRRAGFDGGWLNPPVLLESRP